MIGFLICNFVFHHQMPDNVTTERVRKERSLSKYTNGVEYKPLDSVFLFNKYEMSVSPFL